MGPDGGFITGSDVLMDGGVVVVRGAVPRLTGRQEAGAPATTAVQSAGLGMIVRSTDAGANWQAPGAGWL